MTLRPASLLSIVRATIPFGCFFGILLRASVLSAGNAPLDTLIFGNSGSEAAHGMTSSLSESYTGDLGQTARRFLPKNPVDYYGGSATFTIQVDPAAQNYFTVKLSGSEFRADSDNGRILLKCEGLEIGNRHGSNEEVFVEQANAPMARGAFVYRTAGLPKWLTQGKTKVTLELQSSGRFYYYGTPGAYDTFQRKLLFPTRGVYRAYTHTNPRFDLPGDDKQGSVPSYAAAAIRPPATQSMADFKTQVNNHINSLIKTTTYLKPNIPNNYYNDAEYLAVAYSIPWTTGYHNPALVAQVINSVDKNCADYNADNTKVNAWGGAYGRFGYAVHLLWPQVQAKMSETVNLGLGPKTRAQYWAALFKASFDTGRFHRRTITNQEIECVMSIYGANQALLDINPSLGVPESEARRYLYEAVGLSEWRGDDLPAGGSAWNFGHGYYMMSSKGMSHEPGWVSQDCYGNVGPKMTQIWKMCGDPAVLGRAVAMEKAHAYFRYPSVDQDGYKAILTEGVICWRNEFEPGKIMYGCAWTAAASKDSTLMGYQRQLWAENQFFAAFNNDLGRTLKETKSLYLPDAYDAIAAASASALNPCTPGQTDYAYADEENGVLAVKRGSEMFFIELYRRADAINYLAKAHHITPDAEREIEFYVDDVRFTPSGKFITRDALVEPASTGTPPDNPPSAYKGIQQPIPLLEDGTVANKNRAIAQFYGCAFGNYIIGMNCTKSKSFQYSPPGFTAGVDLVSGKTLTAPITVGPNSTVVFYRAVASAPAGLTATAGDTRVTLTWNAASGAASYTVKRATAASGPFTVVAPGVSSTTFTDAGLNNGTTYYYVVSAVNGLGESDSSPAVSAVPVALPGFDVSVSPATLNLNAGATGSLTVKITPTNGFTGSVVLTVTGLPTGATATFSPASVSGGGSSTLSIQTTPTTSAGSFPLTLRASTSSTFHSASATLVVAALQAASTVYQAEAGTFSPGALVEKEHAGWTGTGYVNTLNAVGSFVEWSVTVPTAATYRLTFRYANGWSNNRLEDLRINGALAQSGVGFPLTGSWTTWKDVTVSKPLIAGTNKIRLTATTTFGAPNLDKLTVEP